MSNLYYEENQKFKPWIYVAMLPVCVILGCGIYKQVVLKEPFGNNPMPDMALWSVFLLMVLMCIGFYLLRLRLIIDRQYIHVSFKPFVHKTIAWKEVDSAELVDYGFVGGWGVRFSKKYGKIYNTSGRIGLWLKLKNGKKILIGTQESEKLKSILIKIKDKKND